MIICRTPYRISFFGGGTDYPAWYRRTRRRGAGHDHRQVLLPHLPLSAAVLRAPHRIVYSKIETVHSRRRDRPPRRARDAALARASSRGLEIHHDGDLPARSGMGSSSSFTVGLLHALHALQGLTCPARSSWPGKAPTSSRRCSRKRSAARTRSWRPTAASTTSSFQPRWRAYGARLC